MSGMKMKFSFRNLQTSLLTIFMMFIYLLPSLLSFPLISPWYLLPLLCSIFQHKTNLSKSTSYAEILHTIDFISLFLIVHLRGLLTPAAFNSSEFVFFLLHSQYSKHSFQKPHLHLQYFQFFLDKYLHSYRIKVQFNIN